MSEGDKPSKEMGQPGFRQAALFGLCPRCGEKTLFETPAQFAMRCSVCQLPFGDLERGGRFAGLVTMVIAVLLILIAVWIENAFRPPLLLQFVVWAPLTVIVVLGSLRMMKVAPFLEAYEQRYGEDGKKREDDRDCA